MDTKCYYAMEDKFFAQQKLNRDLISVICVLAAENAQLTSQVTAQAKVIESRDKALDAITGV